MADLPLDTVITPTRTTKVAFLDTAGNATAAELLALATQDDVGLGSVDNTADLSKPVSTAQQSAINAGVATVTTTSLGLNFVENTALSTWGGSVNIATVGTISTGVWNGSLIADLYISSAATWNAKVDAGTLNTHISDDTNPHNVDKTDVALGNVEDVALSTWAGSASITTLGTIASGTWNGSIVAPAYLGTGASIGTKFLRGDGSWQELAAGTGDALTSNPLSQFAATTAAQLNSVLSDTSLTGTNTGDQDLSAYQLKPSEGAFVNGDKTKLDAITGTNTGDQDLSTYQLKPSEGAFIDGDKTKLDAISGTNTGDQDLIDTFGFACSDETTLLTSGEKIVFYAPYAFTITAIYASLNTAPTVQAVTVDVEFPAGTSLLTSVLSIGTAAFTDEETGMSKVIAKGDRISIDIDQIDTAGAAAGLKIFITHTRT